MYNKQAYKYIFLICYSIWLTAQIINTSLFAVYITGTALYAIRLICILTIVTFGVLLQKEKRKQICFVMLVFIVILIVIKQSTMNLLFDTFVFIYFSRSISLRSVFRTSLCILSGVTIAVVMCSFFGVVDDYINIDYQTGRVRHFLGFRYSLYPQQYAFSITALIVCLYNKNRVYTKYIFALLLNCVLFYYTNSRLSFYLSILLIICSVVLRHLKSAPLPVFKISYPVAALISVLATLFYSSSNMLFSRLNSPSLLGGRLSLGKQALEKYGISIFGNDVYLQGNSLSTTGEYTRISDYNYVDSLFIQMLIRYGLIFLIMFIVVMTLCIRKCIEIGWISLALVLSIIAIHCIIDDYSLQLFFNPLLFSVGILLNEKRASL